MTPSSFDAILKSVEDLSEDTRSFTFEAVQGTPFSDASAGAHIDVHLPGGVMRQYSLWTWDPDGRWGSVAVKREEPGRGGSQAMHKLTAGQTVQLGGPRNNFPLKEDAPHSVLIAGGIGATPIFAMAQRLQSLGQSVEVYYLTRTQRMAAFKSRFEALNLGEALHCRYDDVDGIIDTVALIEGMPAEAHVYCCGPEPLLQAVLGAAEPRLDGECIHFERFSADPTALEGPSDSFEVELAQSGKTVTVPKDKSILEVLQDEGIDAEWGCSEGVCGACIVDVLEGEVDHRDSVLTPDEQAENSIMCICVSRAKGAKLKIDV